jgi:hypothetical protein
VLDDVDRVLGGWNWRPNYSPALVRRELEFIKTALHCTAVKICGRDIGQPRPVRPCQPRSSAGPLAQGDSELMAQHQDLGVLPPILPARQPQQ